MTSGPFLVSHGQALSQRLMPWGGMGTIRSEETSWMLSLLKNELGWQLGTSPFYFIRMWL